MSGVAWTRVRRIIIAVIVAGCAGPLIVWACGPFYSDFNSFNRTGPADPARFDRGQVGIVKPTYYRRYLVQAYRQLNGAPQVAFEPLQPPLVADNARAIERWLAARTRVQATWPSEVERRQINDIDTTDTLDNFQVVDVCLADAFDRAALTLAARVDRYGASSRQIRDWLAAQDAVFDNCHRHDVFAPRPHDVVAPPAPARDADALERADRAYQLASALFYNRQFDEAVRKFLDIAADSQSPWQPYGHYLAGRAWLRWATLSDDAAAGEHLDAASSEFRAALADSRASTLHRSAQGLLDLAHGRRDPATQLQVLASRLATSPTVTAEDLTNYTRLMDRVFGETSDSSAVEVDPETLLSGDDMTAWIVAFQRRSPVAFDRWTQTHAATWLVAALWSIDAKDPRGDTLLSAAAQVPAASSAYPLTALLRVRLLLLRGDLTGARLVLATVPTSPRTAFDAEAINLFASARLTTASSLDELLAAAPRQVVALSGLGPDSPPGEQDTFPLPVWDDDVARVLNTRLPLSVLVAAAESPRLPGRLRSRVAQIAFTRAFLLNREPESVRAANVLASLTPAVRADLTRYISAPSSPSRRRLGLLVLLRTPGLSINVVGTDDDFSYKRAEPSRRFAHGWGSNWWCGPQTPDVVGAAAVFFDTGERPFPAFLSEQEREATRSELAQLKDAGDGRTFVAQMALVWAAEEPDDADVAEALALTVEGWRWSPCAFGEKSDLPRRAFTTLHRRYPNSEWTHRTRYWYE